MTRSRATTPASGGERRNGPGLLTVNSNPWGILFIDGRRAAEETPVYRLPVREGVHKVAIFWPDRGTYSAPQRVSIRAGEVRVLGFHQ
jgi:hypothetical protein